MADSLSGSLSNITLTIACLGNEKPSYLSIENSVNQIYRKEYKLLLKKKSLAFTYLEKQKLFASLNPHILNRAKFLFENMHESTLH